MADAPNKNANDRVNDFPWTAPLRVDEVHESGRHVALKADAATTAGLVKFAGVNSVTGLEATFDVTRLGRTGLRVVGEVRARVGQTCVVSLESMVTDIVEAIDVVYEPPRPEPAVPAKGPPAPPGALSSFEVGEDPPELLVDGIADLGALATEFLVLGIDPYPRKPEASFGEQVFGTGESGPFAALAKLKYGDGEEK